LNFLMRMPNWTLRSDPKLVWLSWATVQRELR